MEGAIVAPWYKEGSLQPLWHVTGSLRPQTRRGSPVQVGVTTAPLGQGGGPRWGCTWWVMVRVGVGRGPRAGGGPRRAHTWR